MGDGSGFAGRQESPSTQRRSRYGDALPGFAQEAYPPAPTDNQSGSGSGKDKTAGTATTDKQMQPPAASEGNAPQVKNDASAPPATGDPAGTRPPIGVAGAPIDSSVPSAQLTGSPPTYQEALEYRRGKVNDDMAGRDRWIFRIGQLFTNSIGACLFSGIIEPGTAAQRAQLSTIDAQLAGGTLAQAEITALTSERRAVVSTVTSRGRWRGPLGVLGVTAADYAVDKVLFPGDHIKHGTLLADFIGAPLMMLGRTPWRYKALGMVGMHAAGRIYDHFIQGKEATNNGKPDPFWTRSPSIDRALQGVKPADPSLPTAAKQPAKPVYHPPNEEFINSNSGADQKQRELNAAQQRQKQEEAQRQYQSWQEALATWRREHPGASSADESQFMRDWYRQNGN